MRLATREAFSQEAIKVGIQAARQDMHPHAAPVVTEGVCTVSASSIVAIQVGGAAPR